MITITEALAELKLINSKIEKKKTFVLTYVGRQEGAKDPLEKQGGTQSAIKAEMQAVKDLTERFVRIRSAIATANANTIVEVGGVKRFVADWLTWRRSAAPMEQGFQNALTAALASLRRDAKSRGFNVAKQGETPQQMTDVVIEIDEKQLSESIEKTQEILDTLDGKLSLHNATVQVEI